MKILIKSYKLNEIVNIHYDIENIFTKHTQYCRPDNIIRFYLGNAKYIYQVK